VPGPKGAPWIGNYFSIFPDHLGNNERMFQRYGPIFQSTTMGRKVMQTNDPVLALIALQESDFFSKKTSNENHPLYPLRDNVSGVFLSDTDDPSWKIVHKFMPPCLGPKAVRHYAPLMNNTINEAIPVFDKLESDDQSW
jgi:cytochrome P450